MTYPNCRTDFRMVNLCGLTKNTLIEAFAKNAILMNGHADRLFASDHYRTTRTRYVVNTVELTVVNLGFPGGSTIDEIYERAGQLGLGLCPLEMGPHLRLQYPDQPEGYWDKPVREHQAPYGAITIASGIPNEDEDEDFPKGFYLRRIKGVLWLRGYRSGPEHVWAPDDHFVFVEDRAQAGPVQLAS